MKQHKNLSKLLTPSWLVNVIAIAAGLLVTTTIIVLTNYQGSSLQQQVASANKSGSALSNGTYNSITDKLANNHLLGTLPLLLVWAGVGLVVYFFAINIAQGIGEAARLREETTYVNASKESLVRDALQKLGLRVVVLIGWFLFIQLTVKVVAPYAFALAIVGAQGLSLASIGCAALSVVIIYLDVYVHAVFLRAVVLRPRLFGR